MELKALDLFIVQRVDDGEFSRLGPNNVSIMNYLTPVSFSSLAVSLIVSKILIVRETYGTHSIRRVDKRNRIDENSFKLFLIIITL